MNKEDTDKVISYKAKLRGKYQILNSEKSSRKERIDAVTEANTLQEAICLIDKSFTPHNLSEKYPELFTSQNSESQKSETKEPDVKWPEYKETPETKALEKSLEWYTALAVHITKKRHPKMPEDHNVFGQIVNAVTDKLIALQS